MSPEIEGYVCFGAVLAVGFALSFLWPKRPPAVVVPAEPCEATSPAQAGEFNDEGSKI